MITKESGPKMVTVVRLRTTKWGDRDGIHIKRSITLMRRMSFQPWTWDDVNTVGAAEIIERIRNLDTSKDGLYDLSICNQHIDRDTGCVDDYDYELIPYEATT